MSVLYTLNKSPLSYSALDTCLALLTPDDALLLIEEGVYGADKALEDLFAEVPATLYVLQADVQARGVNQRLSAKFNCVDDAQFVDLVIAHDKSHSWY